VADRRRLTFDTLFIHSEQFHGEHACKRRTDSDSNSYQWTMLREMRRTTCAGVCVCVCVCVSANHHHHHRHHCPHECNMQHSPTLHVLMAVLQLLQQHESVNVSSLRCDAVGVCLLSTITFLSSPGASSWRRVVHCTTLVRPSVRPSVCLSVRLSYNSATESFSTLIRACE